VRDSAVGKVRVERDPVGGFGIGVGIAFGGVDPQVGLVRQVSAHATRGVEMVGQADDADAEPNAARVQGAALVKEPFVGHLARMVGRPQRDRVAVAVGQPVDAAGQVRLDRDPLDVWHVA
jgi:hypothetical protein